MSLRGGPQGRRGNLRHISNILQEIATPVCALARNDMRFLQPVQQTAIYQNQLHHVGTDFLICSHIFCSKSSPSKKSRDFLEQFGTSSKVFDRKTKTCTGLLGFVAFFVKKRTFCLNSKIIFCFHFLVIVIDLSIQKW